MSSAGSYGPIDRCQVCDTPDLHSVIFLGFLPPVNRMRELDKPTSEETWYPAELLACPKCQLVQLGYAVDPNVLFPPDYPYTSGSTRILRENFADLYRESSKLLGLQPDDLVVDIGSNDGTLLANFHRANHRVLGVEPSLTGHLAEQRGIPTRMTFFGPEVAREIVAEQGRARLVTACNVFAHIHHIHNIVEGIADLVGDDGVFISESHYLVDLVATLQYDTIYHEHLRYYSLTSLQFLFRLHGFNIFYVKRIPTHGGSIRVYASRSRRYPADSSVAQFLAEEQRGGFAGLDWVPQFRKRVCQSKLDLYELLAGLKRRGQRIYGVGAPSRASTLINYLALDQDILDCVLELPTSKKVDKYMPGTKIPVLPEDKLYTDQPEYAFLLSWHIAGELLGNLRRNGYRNQFIVPLPNPRIIRQPAASAAA